MSGPISSEQVLQSEDQIEPRGISHCPLALPLLMTSQVLHNINTHLIEEKNLDPAHSLFLLTKAHVERALESAPHPETPFRQTRAALLAWSKGTHC